MRTGECMKLKKSDIDFSSTPVKIYLKQSYTKGKIPRMCMLSGEAVTELKKYLDSRADNDERVFPFAPYTLAYHWRRTIDGLGYGEKDPNTGIRLLHIHMTRKWFLSQFPLAASKDIGEMLAGHMGYLSGSYRRYSHKLVAKEFLKAENTISIYNETPVYTNQQELTIQIKA
jgi:integrase